MARRKGAVDIAEMSESLSKLFRIGLSKGNVIIPLSDEMEHIRSYLQIQHVRYQNKLDYALKVAPEIQGLSVLKLILQPIVENAIYHGIKERRGPGYIEIEAMERNGDLVITIRDNGKGMTKERLLALRRDLEHVTSSQDEPGTGRTHKTDWTSQAGEVVRARLVSEADRDKAAIGAGGANDASGDRPAGETKGYGILNVQARLRLTFGVRYGLSVNSTLNEGTVVTVVHPLIRDNYIYNGADRR
ncbi:Sensor histidine kinase YehU [compost metagenome]